MYGGQVFKLDLVMTSVIILAIVAAVMYESIEILEKLWWNRDRMYKIIIKGN